MATLKYIRIYILLYSISENMAASFFNNKETDTLVIPSASALTTIAIEINNY